MRKDSASKLIPAPQESVYRAFIEREAVLQWLPPAGARGTLEQFEPWPGGAFRMTLTFEGAGHGTTRKTCEDSDTVDGRFINLVPPSSIVQQFTFVSDHPEFAGTMTMSWTFFESGGATLVEVVARNVPRGISPADHQRGMESSLDNLAAYLARNP